MSTNGENHAYIVRGGNAISGTLRPGGNKNAALPMLAATLLTGEPVRLHNVPGIRDVRVMISLLEDVGVKVSETADGSCEFDASGLESHEANPELAREIRASFLLAGPLLARQGRAVLPRPGGDGCPPASGSPYGTTGRRRE